MPSISVRVPNVSVRRQKIAVNLRALVGTLVGAEYVVQDDLNNGGGKPVQIRFSGEDS